MHNGIPKQTSPLFKVVKNVFSGYSSVSFWSWVGSRLPFPQKIFNVPPPKIYCLEIITSQYGILSKYIVPINCKIANFSTCQTFNYTSEIISKYSYTLLIQGKMKEIRNRRISVIWKI